MARRKRRLQAANLSFLDCMSCGFGAVILFFMIINATVREETPPIDAQQMSEVRRIEQEILEGRRNLVTLRNSLDEERDNKVASEGQTAELIRRIREIEAELALDDGTTVARRESIEKLRADIKQLEEAKRRLAAEIDDTGPSGDDVRALAGDGTRQYLTGLRLRGKRTLILVDASGSMLDRTVVGVIRRRNLPLADQLRSAKWRQVVASVDWVTSQLQPEARFQIYTFAEDTETLVPGADGAWTRVDDGDTLDEAVVRLRGTAPGGGTNLFKAFQKIRGLSPRPDNILLLVDGLPTLGENVPARSVVSPQQRVNLFAQAIRQLPSGIPVNVLMYPMEGDYIAPVEYWKLAYRTGGSYMSVSDDWP
ncbi:MAG: VWA domain-containing protein [Pseudomonadota bacterium]